MDKATNLISKQIKEENARKEAYQYTIDNGLFVDVSDIYKFLTEQGYNWYQDYAHNDHSNYLAFANCVDFIKSIDNKFILLGNPDDWGDNIDNFHGGYAINNPFVRYVRQTLTHFSIYKIIDKSMGTYSNDDIFGYDDLYKQLEKDLSKEWVKYLAIHKPKEYLDYITMLEQKAVSGEQLETYKKIKKFINNINLNLDELQV